jgi:predicted RecB family nuclease
MKEFMEEKQKEYPNKPIRIFHWSHAEKTFITSADDRHRNKWTKWLSTIEWIDLCQIFKSEPIVVKDAFDFSIKSIGSALFKHQKIKTHWDTNITNGLSAMMDAIKYYKTKDESIIQDIVKYNEIDCKIMWEITDYLRKNHC